MCIASLSWNSVLKNKGSLESLGLEREAVIAGLVGLGAETSVSPPF